MTSVNINISPKSIIITIIFLVLFWVMYKTFDILLLFYAAFVIASFLFPIIDWLSKKMPRWVAVLVVSVAGLIIFITVLIPFIVIILQQFPEFIKSITWYLNKIELVLFNLKTSKAALAPIIPDISQFINPLTNFSKAILRQSLDFTAIIITTVAALFTLIVIVFNLVMDKNIIKDGFLSLFPENRRNSVDNILSDIVHKVGRYVVGEIALMVAIGALTTIGLLIVGTKYALLLGLLSGLLEIVPIIGTLLAAIPAILVGLVQSPHQALWTLLVFLVIQRIENGFLAPYFLSKALHLHPLIILAFLLLFAKLLGFIGVILAPTFAAVAYILLQELYIKKHSLNTNL